MLTRSQFDRLADMRSETQILSALADSPYGEVRATDIDTMLTTAAAEEEAFFSRYLIEETLAGFFRAPDLAGNLKWALRKHYGAEPDENLFIQEGSPSQTEFARMLSGEVTLLPDWLSQAAGEAVAAYYENPDPASIDIIIDKILVEHQHGLSEGYSFLTCLLSLAVDSVNLLTLLRLRIADEDWESFEKAFLPHGEVKVERFKAWWDAGPQTWATEIVKTDRFSRLTEGLREVADSFLPLERQVKEQEIEFLLTARRLTFGYEPLVGYALLKREERLNIGRVAAGLRYGLQPETIRGSIAWYY